MQNPVKIIHATADTFADNTEHAIVIVEISRKEIESCNVSSALERLQILIDNADNVRLYCESIAISVAGYDNDPRELIEIKEVRAFFQKLTEHWPHWMWFLNREIGAVGLILSLLCKVKVHRTPGQPGFGSEFADIGEVMSKMRDLFARGNALFEAYGITDEEIERSAGSALDAISK